MPTPGVRIRGNRAVLGRQRSRAALDKAKAPLGCNPFANVADVPEPPYLPLVDY